MASKTSELDMKTKTLLTKSLEKQYHRKPLKPIDINRVKPGMAGEQEDNDDYHIPITNDDNESMIIDKDLIKSIGANLKQRKKK